jgi:hypothetical protein
MTTDTLLLIAAEWIGVIALGMLVGISPKVQKIRPLQLLFPHREASVSFSLNIVAFIFGIFLYKYYFTASTEFSVLDLNVLMQRLILDGIVLLIFLAALIVRKQPIRSALWSKEGLRPGLEFSLLITALVIFLRGKIFAIINGLEAGQGVALVELLVIGLCEATIFFGFTQSRLISRFGDKAGWFMSAALFALWQIIPLALHGATGQIAVFQVALAAGQGIIACWLAQKGRHVLAPAVYLALSQWLFLIK